MAASESVIVCADDMLSALFALSETQRVQRKHNAPGISSNVLSFGDVRAPGDLGPRVWFGSNVQLAALVPGILWYALPVMSVAEWLQFLVPAQIVRVGGQLSEQEKRQLDTHLATNHARQKPNEASECKRLVQELCTFIIEQSSPILGGGEDDSLKRVEVNQSIPHAMFASLTEFETFVFRTRPFNELFSKAFVFFARRGPGTRNNVQVGLLASTVVASNNIEPASSEIALLYSWVAAIPISTASLSAFDRTKDADEDQVPFTMTELALDSLLVALREMPSLQQQSLQQEQHFPTAVPGSNIVIPGGPDDHSKGKVRISKQNMMYITAIGAVGVVGGVALAVALARKKRNKQKRLRMQPQRIRSYPTKVTSVTNVVPPARTPAYPSYYEDELEQAYLDEF
jgi:hypothetical protein